MTAFVFLMMNGFLVACIIDYQDKIKDVDHTWST